MAASTRIARNLNLHRLPDRGRQSADGRQVEPLLDVKSKVRNSLVGKPTQSSHLTDDGLLMEVRRRQPPLLVAGGCQSGG